jgi:DNA (cytosine-5)-methyltransferase 1
MNVVETFVGTGGSHIGFKKAGFKTIFVNDIWSDAINTLKQNNHELKDNQIILDDIKNITSEELKKRDIDISNIDVLIGGVVCKGFSNAGLKKSLDPRNYLYLEQLRLVKLLNPKISIIENVPPLKNAKILKKDINDELILKLCNELDNVCKEYGRTYNKELLKKRKELESKLNEYKYSVFDDIIKRYNDMNYNVHYKILNCNDYECYTTRRRLIIVAVRKDLDIKWEYPEKVVCKDPLTVRHALSLIDYKKDDIDNKPMNHRKQTIEKYNSYKPGLNNLTYRSCGASFRLYQDKPAPTLMGGNSSFQIHPTEPRCITIREAATISGFPLDYKFYGSHSSKGTQITNAIPVNLAYHIALT